ncbi:MAG: NAD(P)H-dependent oxidoreductase [Candidatus Acidiferrales bacterium]
MDNKIKILCISASPVIDGNTEKMLSIFATRAFSLDADVEIIRLHEHPAPAITGKLEGWKPDPYWATKLEEADAVIVATPTYWFAPPPVLTAWIDSLTPFTYESKLDGLMGGVLVYGPEGGSLNVAQYIGMVFNNIGITVPARGLIWQEGPRRGPGPNAWVEPAIQALAENIISLVTALRSIGESDNVYLATKIKRYRARSKKPISVAAFIEPQPEEEVQGETDETKSPELPPSGKDI